MKFLMLILVASAALADPSVSPDGRWISYVSDGDLFAVRPNGRDLRRLTETPDEESSPAWSPDSRKLVFTSGGRVWVLDFKSRRLVPVTTHDTDTPPMFAPDGKLVFGSESGALYTMKIDGSERKQIFQHDPPRPITVHGWSKRGFVALSVKARDRTYLATVRVSRGKIGYVTPTEELFGEAPAWSPTGDFMAFQGVTGGNVDIYVLDVLNGNLRRLTENAATDSAPSWSADESWLAFRSDRDGGGIFAIDLATRKVRRIVQ